MKTTIVIPIIYFNNYSIKVVNNLSNYPKYDNLEFLFVVSCPQVKKELLEYILDFHNTYRVINANSYSSNYLRSQASNAFTEYVFFQDCDDEVDYEYINHFTLSLKDTDYVHVFNVLKVGLDSQNEILWKTNIYTAKDGLIRDIQDLSQNVYSKFIPTKLLKNIEFPNLPFTQDWAISYNLYLIAPHIFHNKSIYTYYFYPSSSSKSRYDTKFRLLRVMAYGKDLILRYNTLGYHLEASYLEYIYYILLSNRFYGLGEKLKFICPSLKLFIYLNKRKKISMIYQYSRILLRRLRTK